MSFRAFFIFAAIAILVFSHTSADYIEDYCRRNLTGCVDPWVSRIPRRFHSEKNLTSVVEERNYVNVVNDVKSSVPWFLNIPILPVLFATSPTLPDGECRRQAQRYMQELRNGTLWAARMFDSSVKYPEGIVAGHTRHFGNFDECYELNAKIPGYGVDSGPEEISGSYCLVEIEYEKVGGPQHKIKPLALEFDPNDSVWEAIKEKGDFRRVRRYILELALCVPSSCSADDVEQALKEPLRKIGEEQHLLVRTSIKGDTCQSKEREPEFSTGARIYCYILLGLFFLVGLSTWYDTAMKSEKETDSESLATNLLLCFSATRNFKSIMEISHTHPGLDSIHMIRFSMMCLVLFGHRLMQYFSNPMINSEYLEYSYTLSSSMMLYNGPIIVDAFFALGGLLVAYFLLKELDKKKTINFVAAIVMRYVRLTPSYIAIIMFIALVLPHMGSGPYWNHKIGMESSFCAENWWTNILYINNYVNTEKSCMFQSWYVSTDYHLYVIALFAVYLFWKLPRRLGYLFLVCVIVLGCAIPFYLTYQYNIEPLFRGTPVLHEVRQDPYFINHYIKTHERIAPYFVGVVAGAIIYDHGLSSWRLPKLCSSILFILLVVVLSISSQSLGFKFFDPNVNPSPLEAALYASLHRPVFALAAVSIVVLLTVGEGLEFHHNFFRAGWIQPLARLTYGAYLIHNINQCYDIGVVRQSRTFTIHNAFWDFVPDVILTFTLALVVSLTIEGPFRRIEKVFINKRAPVKKAASENDANSTTTIKKIS